MTYKDSNEIISNTWGTLLGRKEPPCVHCTTSKQNNKTNTMEQKYAYLSNTGRKLFNDDFMDALDALKHDVGDEVDEDFDEKERCLEMLKNFLKDKILTEKDYKYLQKKVYDFYGIELKDFFLDTEREILQELWTY